jgi:NADH:ubiquinone oxidoreductase subunit 6 (subunit J)
MVHPLIGTDAANPSGLWLFPLPLLAGAAAVYLLLPRPRPHPAWWGGALGAVALVLAGALVLRVGAVSAENLLFYVFSGAAVVGGTLLVTQHIPARAALSFTVVILSVTGLFLLLAAPFLMAATVIIYAGAIIVTFLFVLMLAQQSGLSDADDRSCEPALSVLTGLLLLGALVYVLQLGYEQNETVRAMDDVLARVRAAGNLTPEQLGELTGPLRDALESDGRGSADRGELLALQGQLDNLRARGLPPDRLRRQAEDAVLQARHRHGFLQPGGGDRLSDQSGPPANLPAGEVRYGWDGRARMPADNATYLGRSLFTDYLLPVELGGVLLLVAAVGAIAIAHRRAGSGRVP